MHKVRHSSPVVLGGWAKIAHSDYFSLISDADRSKSAPKSRHIIISILIWTREDYCIISLSNYYPKMWETTVLLFCLITVSKCGR